MRFQEQYEQEARQVVTAYIADKNKPTMLEWAEQYAAAHGMKKWAVIEIIGAWNNQTRVKSYRKTWRALRHVFLDISAQTGSTGQHWSPEEIPATTTKTVEPASPIAASIAALKEKRAVLLADAEKLAFAIEALETL